MPSPWWLCPNEPRCPHGATFHDLHDYEDQSPTCCMEGCSCGRGPVASPAPEEPTPDAR